MFGKKASDWSTRSHDVVFVSLCWPSYSLLRYLLPFPTNHDLGFIHIYSHASVLNKILPLIKPFNQIIFSLSYHNLSIHKSKLHIIYIYLLPNSVFEDPFYHFHSMFQQFDSSVRSTLHSVPFPFVYR